VLCTDVIVGPMQLMAFDRQKSPKCLTVYLTEVPITLDSDRSLSVYLLSSAIFECMSHIWQRRQSSMTHFDDDAEVRIETKTKNNYNMTAVCLQKPAAAICLAQMWSTCGIHFTANWAKSTNETESRIEMPLPPSWKIGIGHNSVWCDFRKFSQVEVAGHAERQCPNRSHASHKP